MMKPSNLAVRALAGTVGLSALCPVAAYTTEQPISGAKLVLQQTSRRSSLEFTSKDGAFLLPTPGGSDDPRLVGLELDVTSLTGETGHLSLPPSPTGWTVRTGHASGYKFRDASSTLDLALLQQGRTLRIKAHAATLGLTTPQGGVAIRVRTGSLLNCAFFDTPSVDVTGRFVARKAPAPASCSTGATTTTTTIPNCSGEGGICIEGGGCCPGLQCASTGGPHALGGCVGSCASRLGRTCASNVPGAHPIACCPDQSCVLQSQDGFVYGTCESTPPASLCCQTQPGSLCADVDQASPAGCTGTGLVLEAGAPGSVCDGTTGQCAPTRSGETGCCPLGPGPVNPCLEGPTAQSLCTLFSAPYSAGFRCVAGAGCVAP